MREGEMKEEGWGGGRIGTGRDREEEGWGEGRVEEEGSR